MTFTRSEEFTRNAIAFAQFRQPFLMVSILGLLLFACRAPVKPRTPHLLLIGGGLVENDAAEFAESLGGEYSVTVWNSTTMPEVWTKIQHHDRDQHWDLVVVHMGWKDIHRAPDNEGRLSTRARAYTIHLQRLFDRLVESGAEIVYVTIPPTPKDSPFYLESDVLRYNQLGKETAARYGATILDLHAFCVSEELVPGLDAKGHPAFTEAAHARIAAWMMEGIRARRRTPSANTSLLPPVFSGGMHPDEILAVARAVADWQLARKTDARDDWTWALFYTGLFELGRIENGEVYLNMVKEMGRVNAWRPGERRTHADDHAIAQVYLDLYGLNPNPAKIAPVQQLFDELIQEDVHGSWHWIDALYMGAPVLSRLSLITGDPRYLDYMIREWNSTVEALFDSAERLYYRDLRRKGRLESNGERMFWSRGNGWVLAALARILPDIPDNHPSRPAFEKAFIDLADRISAIQPEDGLWRAGLLDPEAYPLPESSGTALFVYGLARGVRIGLLDAEHYLPVIRKAWHGLTTCVFADGMPGYVQPPGGGPGPPFGRASSYPYGSGAFLLAATETYYLAMQLSGTDKAP